MNLDWTQISAMVALTLSSHAMAWEPVTLRELYLTHKTFKAGSRIPEGVDGSNLADTREIGQEVDLDFNVDFLDDYFFWNNHVWSTIDRWEKTGKMGVFRNVGWNWRIGFRPCDYLEVGYWHFSKHMLDANYSKAINDGKFPVEDALEIRFWLYKDGKI